MLCLQEDAVNAPQIGVMYVDEFPADPFEEFAAALKHPNLKLQIEPREPPGPYAGVEWLFPTAVIVFVGKAYFDAFLKEAGKDHYHLLRAAIKKLASKFIGPSAPTVRLSFSDGKVKSPHPKYSLVYSVIAEIGDGLSVKLLLEPGLAAEECNQAIDAFTGFLEALFSGTLDPASVRGLADAKPVGRLLLVAFNREDKILEVMDPIPKHVRDKQA